MVVMLIPMPSQGAGDSWVLLEIHVGNVDMGLCSVVSCDIIYRCFQK